MSVVHSYGKDKILINENVIALLAIYTYGYEMSDVQVKKYLI